MSAPNAGRQSPEPEQAPEKVSQQVEGKVGAAPSDTHAQEVSDNAKENMLSSNPSHPLEGAAEAKVSKEGRGEGI
ncbi:MAG: hypothetical protein LQ340_008121 [Diploschistes diacapsis]|nr:MAG: hypothetical protein LQ340_008121 [Diploschistes diacapsis]